MKRIQQGFTLVEIAIVLVIVGLLLGGILKGQEMITQAKVKNAITDFSGVSAAYFGYQDRYRATPGDDNGATRWGTTVLAGDGDRVLEGTYAAASASPETAETRFWWDHLRRSGFIAGAGYNQPSNAFNGVIGVQTGDGAATPASALVSSSGGFSNIILCSSNLPDKVAIALDTQMDDGDVRAGSVRGKLHASGDSSSPAVPAAVDTNNYAETGTNVYTLCRPF